MMPLCAAAQTFVDIWSGAGFSSDEASQGVALGDYNADGYPDVFLPSIIIEVPVLPDLGGPNQCYTNDGNGRFNDAAAWLGLADNGQSQGASWADFDNDGALDLYVVRGLQEAIPQNHLLYRQAGGSFDPAPSAYVTAADAGRSVCWADYNNDGYVDVFVTNGLDSTEVLPDSRIFLFRNNGDGSFTDVTILVGMEDRRNGHGCAWSDFDNDGDQDLYIANKGFEDPVLGLSDPHPNALWVNQWTQGTEVFVDMAESAGVDGIDTVDPGGASFGASWADFNNDGWMDLYVTNGFSGLVPFPTPNRLYRNNGDGSFTDVTLFQFLTSLSTESSFSSTWGDYDNDGDLDLFVSNGNVPMVAETTHDLYLSSGWPLYMFDNVAAAAGVEAAKWSNGCASADFNRDGYLDIYVTNGLPGVELLFNEADSLFQNNGGGNHWLQLDLVGVVSNRSAVGARVTAQIGGSRQTREVSAGQGYQSMDDLRVEFGLGGATRVDTLTIRWPSGCEQILTDVAADQVLEVIEDCVFDSILRKLFQTPVAGMFPLPEYATAPATGPWTEPEPVITNAATYFYQHSQDRTIYLVRSGDTLQMDF
jgi:hypothetical protein